MKTTSLAALFAIGCAGCAPPTPPARSSEPLSAAPGNAVLDNGFESDIAPTLSSSWSGPVVIERNQFNGPLGAPSGPLNAMSGLQNALIPGAPNGSWVAVNQRVNVYPNTRYRVGAWLETSADVNAGMFDVRAASNYNVIGHLQYGPFGDHYHYASYEFEAGSENAVWVYAGYFTPGPSSTVRVDNLNMIPNRVGDGGFEQDTLGAQPGSPWLADSRATVASASAHGGSKGVHLANIDANWHAVNQWVNNLTANTNYQVEGWVRTSSGLGNVHIDVRDQNGAAVLNGASPPPSASFEPISFTFNSAGNTTVLIYAGYFGGASNSYLDIDDLSIFETDPPPVPAGAFSKTGDHGSSTCSDICTNHGYDGGPVGSCVGGFVDSGLGASNLDCSQAPGYLAGRDVTCYCQPLAQTFLDTPNPSPLTQYSTTHLGQLTNTVHRNNTATDGFTGTDNAMSFATSHGRVMLFGDAWDGTANWNDEFDPVAFVSASPVGKFQMPQLSVFMNGSTFDHCIVPNVVLNGGSTPRDGLEVNGLLYVFLDSGDDQNKLSSLGRTNGGYDPGTNSWHLSDMSLIGTQLSNSKFLLLSHVTGDDGYLYFFGTPSYYAPNYLYLARVSPGLVASRASWAYYAGTANGVPVFSAGEENAIPIFGNDIYLGSDPTNLTTDTHLTEVSVARHQATGLYLMTYHRPRGSFDYCATQPCGIVIRTAPSVTGPWSEMQRLFDPDIYGYTQLIHKGEQDNNNLDDGLADRHPGSDQNTWGGEYAPYLNEDWFQSIGGVHHILYTMSTFTPYQVQIMDSVLLAAGATPPSTPPDPVGTQPVNLDFSSGLNGWNVTDGGGSFVVYTAPDGTRRLTTYTAAGDATTGTLWQTFVPGTSSQYLNFTFCGGNDGDVKLYFNDDVVRESFGRDTCDQYSTAKWNLTEYYGQTVKLVIEDSKTTGWSYIDTSSFSFTNN